MFDTIDHDVLLDRLNGHCGLTGPALSWFTSYLRGQTQVVNIGNASSQMINIRFGVPRGSVLGWTLFTTYICQLPSVTATDGVTIDGFCDDTQARIRLPFPKNPSPSAQFSTSLSLLSTWCLNCERFYLENRLRLNVDKTVYFLAAPKNKRDLLPDTPLTVGSLEISPVIKCRNLRVLFDSGLTMERRLKVPQNQPSSTAHWAHWPHFSLPRPVSHKSTRSRIRDIAS